MTLSDGNHCSLVKCSAEKSMDKLQRKVLGINLANRGKAILSMFQFKINTPRRRKPAEFHLTKAKGKMIRFTIEKKI